MHTGTPICELEPTHACASRHTHMQRHLVENSEECDPGKNSDVEDGSCGVPSPPATY